MNELNGLIRHSIPATFSLLLACACSSSDASKGSGEGGLTGPSDAGGKTATPGFKASAVADLKAKHIDKYVGKASLSDSTTNTDGDTVYNFDPADGAECYLGDPYHVIVHDAGSQNLLIFLQGGGACWETLCQATSTAGTSAIKSGILNQDPSTNVVGGWNIVYAPYCDGSVFSGDNDMTGPMGQDWHFHGLANLSAVIDVAKKAYPNPNRILLAGTSGGGYGTLTGTGLVRLAYPHTRLDVFNDAGLGLSNTMNPDMLQTVKKDWKFDQYIPDSCTACQTGVQTAIIGWGLDADPTLRVSGFSSYGDGVIGGVFLGLMPADFKQLLLTETGKIHDAYPDRFERFFIDGTQHTVLISPPAAGTVDYTANVDGLSVAEWTRDMLSGDPAWKDHLQGADGG